MSEPRNRIAAVAACAMAMAMAFALTTTNALAQNLASACQTFSRSSPIMKDVAGDKAKWCGCIAANITPAEHNNAALVMKAQTETEIAGGLFNLDSVPQQAAAKQYFDALGVCLPILLGESTGGAPSGAAAALPSTPPALSCPPVAAAAAGKVEGIAAWARLVGNTTASKVNGKEYADFYREDGTVKTMRDRDLLTGKWSYEDGKACVVYPKEDKKCYAVTADGDVVSFSDKPGQGIRTTLLKGNPRKL